MREIATATFNDLTREMSRLDQIHVNAMFDGDYETVQSIGAKRSAVRREINAHLRVSAAVLVAEDYESLDLTARHSRTRGRY